MNSSGVGSSSFSSASGGTNTSRSSGAALGGGGGGGGGSGVGGGGGGGGAGSGGGHNRRGSNKNAGSAGGGVSTTMRARKVIYDEYTNTFYVETRVEALERQVATRAKLTDVLNRSHDTKLRNHKKQVDAEKDIFEKKTEKETQYHKEQLKDHVAHRHVLSSIARSRVTNEATGQRAESHLGHYGVGAGKLEIQPLIEKMIKDNSATAKRLRQSKNIQSKRREVKLFDRTRTTSALLRMKNQVKSRPESDMKSTEEEEESSPATSNQLILPPITVRWARHKAADDKGETIQGTRQSGPVNMNDYKIRYGGDRSGEGGPLPTVFVTQGRYN